MKRLSYIIFLTLLIPGMACAQELFPYGPWQCTMSGNDGLALVNIDPINHVFTMKLPIGSSFNFPFQTFIAEGETAGLILLTPDHVAHPVDVVKTKDGAAIDFYDIKQLPALQCKRPTEKAPIGF